MGESYGLLPDQSQFGPTGLQWYFLNMRERNKWVIEQGGEKVLYYQIRREGTVCSLYDKVRMTSQQHGQDAICQGSGFVGPNPLLGPNMTTGYFDPIEVTVSLVNSGAQTVEVGDFGRRQTMPVRCRGLWEPLFTEGSFLVRRNNTRLWILAPTVHRFKHYALSQSFDVSEVERNHPIYNIPSGL